MQIITPEIKDKMLEELLSADNPTFDFKYDNSSAEYGVSPNYVEMILKDFDDQGLIRAKFHIGNGARIHIQAKAMDLYRHGGFVAEEELLKANIDKLRLELESLSKQLEPKYTEKASYIAQIAGAIMQGLALFK